MLLDTIKERLKQDFQPEIVEVKDESHKHAGHAGYGTFSHLHIIISASAFTGKSRVEREMMVRRAINATAKHDIHAVRFEFV